MKKQLNILCDFRRRQLKKSPLRQTRFGVAEGKIEKNPEVVFNGNL